MLPYQHQIHSILEAYLLREGASHKTTKNYRSDVDDFLSWFSADCATTGYKPSTAKDVLQQMDSQTLERYKSHLIQEQKSQATIIRRFSSLRSLLRAAEESGISTPAIHQPSSLTNQTIQSQQPLKNTTESNIKQSSNNSPTLKSFNELEAFKTALKNQGVPDEVLSKKADHIADFLSWFHTRRMN